MEANVSSELLAHFYKRAKHHRYEVSDTVCQLPDKIISKGNSHVFK